MENEVKTVEKNEIQKVPKNISEKVYSQLEKYQEQGLLKFSKNYNVGNALMGAYLTIQQDEKLRNTTDVSKVQSMIDMAVMGLNPRKNQCYLIPRGNRCTLSVSYFGKQAILKKINGVLNVFSNVIYKDTQYEIVIDDMGNEDIKIVKPCPLELRKNENIIGAYAKILLDENVFGVNSYTEIMTIEDIKNAHDMGSAKGGSLAHKKFLNEMARKSVINRCAKNFVNTSLDDDLVAETFIQTQKDDYGDYDNQEKYYKKEKVVVNTDEIINNVDKEVIEQVKEEKKQKIEENVKVVKNNNKKSEDIIDIDVDFGGVEF